MGIFTVIGLMSGTSMDGIDVALLETDGQKIIEPRGFYFRPYGESFKSQLRSVLGVKNDPDGRVLDVERGLTERHIQAVRSLLDQEGLKPSQIDLIGFHGHTITHDPAHNFTWQIGNGKMMAQELGISTIYDLRQNDVQHGGQGAPLAPVYHWALAQKQGLMLPCVFLNIGGVANLTYVTKKPEEMIAFDTGPGNALINDVMEENFGLPYDEDGRIAAQGHISASALKTLLEHDFFKKKPPKSLDRESFIQARQVVSLLKPEDQVATLTAFTSYTIAQALKHLPQKPMMWITSGGGRKNKTMMSWLHRISGIEPKDSQILGIDGDALEAQLFGYLAARAYQEKELTFPKTTGVQYPMTGGKLIQRR